MKQYNVWFSYRDGVDEFAELEKVRTFAEDLKQRNMIHGYRLLKNCATDGKGCLSKYQLTVDFENDNQFKLPFAEVNQLGIHQGKHGSMIEMVADFIVETFEDV